MYVKSINAKYRMVVLLRAVSNCTHIPNTERTAELVIPS